MREYPRYIKLDQGRRVHPLYMSWIDMRRRCRKPTHFAYKWYGARGVDVCDRWYDSYEAFVDDMSPWPGQGYTVERIDNDQGYVPNNLPLGDEV